MTIKIGFKGENAGLKFLKAFDENYLRIARATAGAARDASELILSRGRADIRSAGNFGDRWTRGLSSEVQPRSGNFIKGTITVRHAIPYFSVFEKGATIRGKPLMWIPLSHTGLSVSAKEYAQTDNLIYVARSGKSPLLIAESDREPKYFGIPKIRLKQRFHLRDICTQVMREFPGLYNKHLKV